MKKLTIFLFIAIVIFSGLAYRQSQSALANSENNTPTKLVQTENTPQTEIINAAEAILKEALTPVAINSEQVNVIVPNAEQSATAEETKKVATQAKNTVVIKAKQASQTNSVVEKNAQTQGSTKSKTQVTGTENVAVNPEKTVALDETGVVPAEEVCH